MKKNVVIGIPAIDDMGKIRITSFYFDIQEGTFIFGMEKGVAVKRIKLTKEQVQELGIINVEPFTRFWNDK